MTAKFIVISTVSICFWRV